ncbi:MAG TPA: RluA family pseudouridine synthase [Candidatus Margulisiibacteriota bacterium]|nr:RluA family pseudouridine synthase [Candidatus Margulisiibacteriota bacterium]
MNIPVLYEDEWLVALDKPSGLLVIPTPKKEKRTLTSILNEDLKARALPYRLHPCHRLDKETSGAIIYAKGKSVQQKMMGLFHGQKVKKRYIAFLQGKPVEREGEINYRIEGKPAVTYYRVIEQRKEFAVVEAEPLTGRTNQIRIHFKNIGHPVLGERKFAFRRDFKIRAKRLCLHAKELNFTHPLTGKSLNLAAPLAAEMVRFLEEHAD